MREYCHSDNVATREFKRLHNEIEKRDLIIKELKCENTALKKNGIEACEKHQTKEGSVIAGVKDEQLT